MLLHLYRRMVEILVEKDAIEEAIATIEKVETLRVPNSVLKKTPFVYGGKLDLHLAKRLNTEFGSKQETREGVIYSEAVRAIREAITAQTGNWGSVEIRAHLDTHYPSLSTHISANRLFQVIYDARQSGLCRIKKMGPPGGANTYVTTPQTA